MTPALPDHIHGIELTPLFEAREPRRFLDMLHDYDLMKYSEQRHKSHTSSTVTAYISSFDHHSSHLWEITTNGGTFLGTITAYRDIPNGVANMGILMRAGRPPVGYGLHSWNAVLNWLLSAQGGMRKVEAGCMAENTRMTKIFEKSGMEIEGTRKDHFIFEGRPMDLIQVAKFRT